MYFIVKITTMKFFKNLSMLFICEFINEQSHVNKFYKLTIIINNPIISEVISSCCQRTWGEI